MHLSSFKTSRRYRRFATLSAAPRVAPPKNSSIQHEIWRRVMSRAKHRAPVGSGKRHTPAHGLKLLVTLRRGVWECHASCRTGERNRLMTFSAAVQHMLGFLYAKVCASAVNALRCLPSSTVRTALPFAMLFGKHPPPSSAHRPPIARLFSTKPPDTG